MSFLGPAVAALGGLFLPPPSELTFCVLSSRKPLLVADGAALVESDCATGMLTPCGRYMFEIPTRFCKLSMLLSCAKFMPDYALTL